MLKRLITLSAATFGLMLMVTTANAQQVLENARLVLGNPIFDTVTTHQFIFETSGTFNDEVDSISFKYADVPSGTQVYPDALINDATLTSIVAASTTNWTGANGFYMDSSITNNDQIRITAPSGDPNGFQGGTNTVTFGNVQNPALGDCTQSSGNSTSTCYVTITTYSDQYSTATGTTTVSFTVTQGVTVSATVDPSFELIISGMPAGTINGTATTIAPTVTTIPFGNLTPGTEVFAGQKSVVTTNATGGYSITVRMGNNMTGSAYGSDIDQFAGGGANSTTSTAWTVPTGTATGANSGWLGVGTTDHAAGLNDGTPVTGAAADQFFPLGTTAQTVNRSTTSVNSQNVYYVYGIEVNSFQLADSYSGTLRYNALPVY
jgi:hypothetical protein